MPKKDCVLAVTPFALTVEVSILLFLFIHLQKSPSSAYIQQPKLSSNSCYTSLIIFSNLKYVEMIGGDLLDASGRFVVLSTGPHTEYQ